MFQSILWKLVASNHAQILLGSQPAPADAQATHGGSGSNDDETCTAQRGKKRTWRVKLTIAAGKHGGHQLALPKYTQVDSKKYPKIEGDLLLILMHVKKKKTTAFVSSRLGTQPFVQIQEHVFFNVALLQLTYTFCNFISSFGICSEAIYECAINISIYHLNCQHQPGGVNCRFHRSTIKVLNA